MVWPHLAQALVSTGAFVSRPILPFLSLPARPAASAPLGEETGFPTDRQTLGVFALTPIVWEREVTERLMRQLGHPGGQETGVGGMGGGCLLVTGW